MKRFIFTSLLALVAIATGHAQTKFNTSQINWAAQTGCTDAGYPWVPADGECEAPGASGAGVWHSGAGAPSEGTAATITHVQGIGANGCSTAFGSSVTAGNLLLVLELGEGSMTNSIQPTDTVGTVFVYLGQAGFGGGTVNVVLWGGYAAASGADTVAWSCGSVTNPTSGQDEYSNAARFPDVAATPVLNAANPSTSLTPTLSGDLVVGYGGWLWANGVGLSYTAGSGFTLGATWTGTGIENPNAMEYIAGGGTSSTAVAISQTGNTGSGSAWNGIALFAKHTGSVGSDGDWYVNTSTWEIYGPRTAGVYVPTGQYLVAPDGSTIGISAGAISVLNSPKVGGVAVSGTPSSGNVPIASDATHAAWGTPAGGGGAFVAIATQTLGSAASSVTFSSISGSYTSLVLTWNAGTSSSSNDTIYLHNNGGSSLGYWNCFWQNFSGFNSDHQNGDSAGARIGYTGKASDGITGGGSLWMLNYASSTLTPWITAQVSFVNSGSSVAGGSCYTYAEDGGPVTSLTLTLGSASNFLTGSTFTLYGVQ
jgi:hypothetical protein